MMNPAEVSGILDAIYESAVFPEHWPQALEKLQQAFDCRCAALIDRNLRTLEGRATASSVDPSSQREFLDVWSARDLVRQRTRTWRAGAIELDHQIVPKSEILASDYYNGFMKPRDMHALMRLTLGMISRAAGISAGCPGAMKPFCRSTTICAVRAGSSWLKT